MFELENIISDDPDLPMQQQFPVLQQSVLSFDTEFLLNEHEDEIDGLEDSIEHDDEICLDGIDFLLLVVANVVYSDKYGLDSRIPYRNDLNLM